MTERFQIIRLIGKSGTGGIYEATDRKHNRKILLHRFFSERGDTSVIGWDYLFNDIIRQWKLIDDSGIVKLHEAGIDDDGAFMSLHYFESSPLLTFFPTTMTLSELYSFARQSAQTLGKLHDRGVIHGALTPNSFLVSEETVNENQYLLSDLGLTQLVPKINRSFAIDFLPSDPAILAPELFEKLIAVPVTDIYMIGHIYYYMVAGAHPLADLPVEEAERRHFQHEIPRLDEICPHVPEEIATWLQSMMLPHPDDRLQDIAEVLESMPNKELFFENEELCLSEEVDEVIHE